jgi:diaminohydroxyphosphoribosylaminopyrimidine deaminase/5-amino-6-(5-phosphoribosylamino)uracil reductase
VTKDDSGSPGGEPKDAKASERRHAKFMRQALELAANGRGLAPPNPMVGAVIVAGEKVVGTGWHEGPGNPHAEINALVEAGEAARRATLYVTLEPCSHQGRTPPCAPALVEASIAQVVGAIRDPNPQVNGRGFKVLRQAGVSVVEGIMEAEAARLNTGFFKHVRTGLPFVTLKMAASLDGKVAARDGSSRWISGEAAREDAHRLRAGSDAILVGAGTALVDDPSLTVRLEGYRGRAPLRIVVDGRGRVPAAGAVFGEGAPTMIATTETTPRSLRILWEHAGAEVLVLEDEPLQPGLVPLPSLMEALGKRDVQSVLIEGGPTLAWEAVRSGVVDRLVLYLAPKLLGGQGAPGVLGGRGVESIAAALPLEIVDVQRIGEDLRVEADVHRDR